MGIPRKQKRSRQQESRVAEGLGGRRVSGSGSGWITKNDVKNDELSVEVKYTDKKSYSLKHADLKKAEQNALMDSGREFAFIVGFGEVLGQGTMRIKDEYVVISRGYFENLRNHGHSQ